jgi:hypothetical protein
LCTFLFLKVNIYRYCTITNKYSTVLLLECAKIFSYENYFCNIYRRSDPKKRSGPVASTLIARMGRSSRFSTGSLIVYFLRLPILFFDSVALERASLISFPFSCFRPNMFCNYRCTGSLCSSHCKSNADNCVIIGNQPSSTGVDISTVNYPGQYLFEVS